MKPLPLILLNALVTLCIVVAHGQIRGDPATPPTADEASTTDSSSIEARLAALEVDQRPMLETTGPTNFAQRLKALEARLNDDTAPADLGGKEPREVPRPRPGMIIEREDQVSPESVAEFKKIIHQVKREERTKKIRKRTDKALASLLIDLDESTRQKLAEAYGDFEPRRNEVWAEVKQEVADGAGDADWARVIADTQSRLAGEFRERIVNFVPAGDADDVATQLFPISGSK